MGLRGPQRQSAAIGRIIGLYRPSRRGNGDSRPISYITKENIPTPPDDLTIEGKGKWIRILNSAIHRQGYISDTDLGAFEQHCHNYMFVTTARGELIAYGSIVEGKVTPQFKVYNELLKTSNRSCQEFGLIPSSRTRVEIEAIKEYDKWDDFKL